MTLTVQSTIAAPREQVFAALMDPDFLQRSIPGCERLARREDTTYDLAVKVGVAGLQGHFTGRIALKDVTPPAAYTLVFEGQGTAGFVRGSARVELTDRGEFTDLVGNVDVQVGGLIAAVGARLIEATAKKLAEQFFRTFSDQLRAGRP